MSLLSAIYQKGLSDECIVKDFIKTGLNRIVMPPTIYQDHFEDIDCIVNGVPISIKAQHAGVAYGNIYFELSQQLTSAKDCQMTRDVLAQKTINQSDLSRLESVGAWEPSWYYTGKAEVYCIYQGDLLRIYRKADIIAHVAAQGWLRIRPLSAKRTNYLGGTYRYCNAACGYLSTKAIRHSVHLVPYEQPQDHTQDHSDLQLTY
jgi:hypothetical protein